MAFTAVYDANVLYPASLRDLLVRLAGTGLFRAKWTDLILNEMLENLLASRTIWTVQGSSARARS